MNTDAFHLSEMLCATVGQFWSEPGLAENAPPRKKSRMSEVFADTLGSLAKTVDLDRSFSSVAGKLALSLKADAKLSQLAYEHFYHMDYHREKFVATSLTRNNAVLKYDFTPLLTHAPIGGRSWQIAMCPTLIGSKQPGRAAQFSLWLTLAARPQKVDEFRATIDEITNLYHALGAKGHEFLPQMRDSIRGHVQALRAYDPNRAAAASTVSAAPQTIFLFDTTNLDLVRFSGALQGNVDVKSGPMFVHISYSPAELERAGQEGQFEKKHFVKSNYEGWYPMPDKDEVTIDLKSAIAGVGQMKKLADGTIGQGKLDRNTMFIKTSKPKETFRFEATCVSIKKDEPMSNGGKSPVDGIFGFCHARYIGGWVIQDRRYDRIPEQVPFDRLKCVDCCSTAWVATREFIMDGHRRFAREASSGIARLNAA